MWVAKISDNLGKLFDYELSPRFESIYECQKFIDENLKDIETSLSYAFIKILFRKYEKGILSPSLFISGRFIRCYNITQKRWCDGFDF